MANKTTRRRVRPAHTVFFPAAALYAMLAVPVSLSAMRSADPVLPGLATATGHGHEMLFGFALAVVAGFLLTRVSSPQLYAMLGLWLAARATYGLFPGSSAAGLLNIAFAGWVALEAAPQFIRAAKKLRNQVFGPVIVVIALIASAFHLAGLWEGWQWRRLILHEGIVLFATLMFFMGGRIIAPAVAGHLHRQGENLEARVQPRIEGGALALLATALLALPITAARPIAAAATILAGALTGVRLWRWRLWRCRGRPDLTGLGIGYAWLAAGLVGVGLALVLESWDVADTLHALTVGALGTLTLSVMARTRMLRAKQDPAKAAGIPLAVGLLSAAAVARLTASWWPFEAVTMYWVAALGWALAYLLLLRLLFRVPGH